MNHAKWQKWVEGRMLDISYIGLLQRSPRGSVGDGRFESNQPAIAELSHLVIVTGSFSIELVDGRLLAALNSYNL